MFDELLLPTTEYEILKEISDELGISMKDVEKTYSIWIKYLKHISKDTDQTMIDFPELGKMYFSTVRCRNLTSKQEKDYKKKKMENINNFFEGVEYQNVHDCVPIVHRWGINRPNHIKYMKENFTLDELVEKQNTKFYENNNKFIK